MKINPRIFIGTSGWSHDTWKGAFYPEKLPKAKYLDHYASRFISVEMNSGREKITPWVSTAYFVYLRLHNPRVKKGDKISGLLNTWIGHFRDWYESGKDIFCYFDQAGEDCAAIDALRFRDAIENEIGTSGGDEKLLNTIRFAQHRNVPEQQIRAS